MGSCVLHIVDWVVVVLLLTVEIYALDVGEIIVRLGCTSNHCLLLVDEAVLMSLVVQSVRGDRVWY